MPVNSNISRAKTCFRNGTLLLVATVASCGAPPPGPVKKIIDPGKIELASPPSAASNEIWGSFTISQSTHPTAIVSSGIGGACLLADLNHLGIPAMPASNPTRRCTENAECQTGLDSKWFGYCNIEGDKKCWVRPGPNFGPDSLCKIGVPPRPLNSKVDTPHVKLEDLAKQFTYNRPIQWRVVACLNGTPATSGPAAGQPPCKNTDGGDRIEVMGVPRAVPPPP
jgi:hypothetical protein